jgi:hypothetical protein
VKYLDREKNDNSKQTDSRQMQGKISLLLSVKNSEENQVYNAHSTSRASHFKQQTFTGIQSANSQSHPW